MSEWTFIGAWTKTFNQKIISIYFERIYIPQSVALKRKWVWKISSSEYTIFAGEFCMKNVSRKTISLRIFTTIPFSFSTCVIYELCVMSFTNLFTERANSITENYKKYQEHKVTALELEDPAIWFDSFYSFDMQCGCYHSCIYVCMKRNVVILEC